MTIVLPRQISTRLGAQTFIANAFLPATRESGKYPLTVDRFARLLGCDMLKCDFVEETCFREQPLQCGCTRRSCRAMWLRAVDTLKRGLAIGRFGVLTESDDSLSCLCSSQPIMSSPRQPAQARQKGLQTKPRCKNRTRIDSFLVFGSSLTSLAMVCRYDKSSHLGVALRPRDGRVIRTTSSAAALEIRAKACLQRGSFGKLLA